MYFLLLFVEPAPVKPRKLGASAPVNIDFFLFPINALNWRFLKPGNSLEPTPKTSTQGAYLELIACSNSAYYSASLLPGCADYGDHFLVCLSHVQCASLSLSIDANSIDIDTVC